MVPGEKVLKICTTNPENRDGRKFVTGHTTVHNHQVQTKGAQQKSMVKFM